MNTLGGTETPPKAEPELIEVPPNVEPDQESLFFAQQDSEDRQKRRLLNHSLEQDIAHRESYAEKAYSLVQTWVGFLIVLISAQFGLKKLGYGLETEEFIAVVVSLTASMFGFWALVGRYLFPSSGGADQEK